MILKRPWTRAWTTRPAPRRSSRACEFRGARIERIVSPGQASPPGFWYDQEQVEWVVLLSGSAGLLLEGESEPRVLRPGDYVEIPARQKHRVEWTDPKEATVWLTVHTHTTA